MEILFQISLVTVSVCAAAALLKRLGRRAESSIEVGELSSGWLAEQRVRRRDWTGVE